MELLEDYNLVARFSRILFSLLGSNFAAVLEKNRGPRQFGAGNKLTLAVWGLNFIFFRNTEA